MDFNEFQEKIESSKVILAELKPAVDLSMMTLSTGSYTWYMDMERIGPKDSGFYFYPQFIEVREDSVALTQVTGETSVEQTAGSWYFNDCEGTMYLHTSDGATPSTHSILGVFPLLFSNQPVELEPLYYNPRISDVPISVSSNADDIYFSSTTVGGGSISFENNDSIFDKWSCRYIWKNRDISVALGEKEMTAASYATIFSGRLRDRKMTDQRVTFSIQDKREYLHKNLHENVFSIKEYPNLAIGNEGKPIPAAYGYFENAPTYKIDTTAKGVFKFTDHPVLEVLYVYNDGYPIPTSYYTVDLNKSEITILKTYNPAIGQITVTFYGMPGQSIIFTDDFNDGDIESWTSLATGGTYSWTPLNQKVRSSCQDNYKTFLLAAKKFSRGQIEVKVTPQQGTANNYSQGICWDYEDVENFKFLVLMPVIDKVRIYEYINGTLYARANADITIDHGVEYSLKLDVQSLGNVYGFLNGNQVVSYNFAVHPAFKNCGLMQWNGNTSDFDDFIITLDYLSTGSTIVKDICTRWLGIPENDLNIASFDNAEEKAKERLRLYLGSSQERSEQVISRIGISNLCRFLVGADGKVHYSFWDENDNVSFSLTDEMLLDSFESFDQTDDIFYKIKVNYGSTIANPSGTDEEYSEENVKYTYERPYEKKFVTALVDREDAEKLALKLFQLVKAPSLRFKIQTKVPGINMKVGDIVELKRSRGFSPTGEIDDKYRIIGISKEIDLSRTSLTLISETDALGIDLCAQTCQFGCELACLGNCEIICQTTCELACQGYCQIHCQSTCQSYCQTACELECQGTCETACQLVCQDICESACQLACQLACQTCQAACTTFCENHCQIQGEGE
jgi:hypothetical protein